jgi:hypothetical protein
MAELDFKHHVSELPRGEALPSPVQRSVHTEITNFPNYQGAVNKYAEDTNWMSSLGSRIATSASNAIATKLGYELGKNPQGELPPAFTETDVEFRKAYDTQAQATLGLQAHKLISQSNIELASAPRIDSDTIAKSQQSVLKGLDKIFSLAPESVRPQMESQFGGVMISQNETLIKRMTDEQKQDRIDRLKASSKINSENSYSLPFNGIGEDKNGDSKAGLDAVHAQINAANSALAIHDITEEERNTLIETAWKSYYSGKYARQAMKADREKKLPEFTKNLAENPPKDVPLKYRDAVYQNILHTVQQQQQLRSLDENYQMQEMQNRILVDPHISDSDLLDFKSKVSPLKFSTTKGLLLKALQKKDQENSEMTNLINQWGNPAVQTRAPDKLRNQTFDTLVARTVKNSKSGISLDEAEVQVAASAGRPIGVFTETLQNKLKSGNPDRMESGAQQMHMLYEMGAGHALSGLTEQDKVMFATIESLRGSLNPTEAMQTAVNKIYNQSPIQFKANQDSWNNFLSLKTRNISPIQFALQSFDLSDSDFQSVALAQVTGVEILNLYATNYALSYADQKVAKVTTQREIKENYGYSLVNGKKSFVKHPLEKILGYENVPGIAPIIQQDARNSLIEKFSHLKKYYDNGKTNEYWEVLPQEQSKGFHLFGENVQPIRVRRHILGARGTGAQDFDIVLHGNAFDEWDVAVYSKEGGYSPITQTAPYLGIVTYIPNKEWIDAEWNWRHSHGK